ncbi:hypothetical protein N0V84_010726 [Fusarium piperis]|uniref:Uncharacterized protein n=1 Tax=Fusarium piperis TaxID=1435070 RepID=A0A9W8W1C8_9HYPO|nr:hypothetical protein N0V84_010726 [Fusarium piperis]
MPLLHKTAASLLSCLPVPRPQKSHSAAAVDLQDDPKSTSAASRPSSPSPSPPPPPEEIELDVLTSKPAPPPTRPRLYSTLSNSTTSSESSPISESCNSGFFIDSSGLTSEERRKLVEEILQELEA